MKQETYNGYRLRIYRRCDGRTMCAMHDASGRKCHEDDSMSMAILWALDQPESSAGTWEESA